VGSSAMTPVNLDPPWPALPSATSASVNLVQEASVSGRTGRSSSVPVVRRHRGPVRQSPVGGRGSPPSDLNRGAILRRPGDPGKLAGLPASPTSPDHQARSNGRVAGDASVVPPRAEPSWVGREGD
jgi:hypothetical protein